MSQNKKDAFYFSHDSDAKDDPKCMLLIEELGLRRIRNILGFS